MSGFFSFVNKALGGAEETEQKKDIKMPWNDYAKQAQELKIKGKIDDVLKDEILEISQKQENFMQFKKGENSDIYEFNLDDHVDLAMLLISEDKNLAAMYSKLVPLRINEEFFWKSYFYTIEQVKTKVLAKFANSPQELSSHASKNREAILKELDDESEDDDDPILSSKTRTDEVKLLKSQLAIALKRIDELENRIVTVEAKLDTQEANQKELQPEKPSNTPQEEQQIIRPVEDSKQADQNLEETEAQLRDKDPEEEHKD